MSALKPREVQVINWAIWARSVTPNGHYLCSPGQVRAARRMIERGYLSKARRTGDVNFGNPDWLVVVLTKRNAANLRKEFGKNP